jgi:hypothetical protein
VIGGLRWLPPIAIAALAACNDATAPTRSATLCFAGAPKWVGIQNEGQPWRTIASAGGAVSLQLTDHVIIGRVTSAGGFRLATTLEVFDLSRSQAESTFLGRTGKEVHGLVTNIGAADTATALVALGGASLGTNGSYVLGAVPSGPRDLVATHDSLAILRRATDYAAGSEVPVLDFGSPEAFQLASNSVSVNAGGLPLNFWWSDFITARGTRATLVSSFQRCCASRVYSMPASRLVDGDLHHLYVVAGVNDDLRFADRFYTSPADHAITMGPPANVPVFSIDKSRTTLWRVDLAAHAEYDRQVVIIAYDPDPQSVTVIRATREYFGAAPSTWSFVVPDLSNVSGFAELQVTTPSSWEVTESARPWLMPAGARAGDTYLSAYKHN